MTKSRAKFGREHPHKFGARMSPARCLLSEALRKLLDLGHGIHAAVALDVVEALEHHAAVWPRSPREGREGERRRRGESARFGALAWRRESSYAGGCLWSFSLSALTVSRMHATSWFARKISSPSSCLLGSKSAAGGRVRRRRRLADDDGNGGGGGGSFRPLQKSPISRHHSPSPKLSSFTLPPSASRDR